MLAVMTGVPRFELAGILQYVVQRVNHRLLYFLNDEDRQRYLQSLRQALLRFGGRLHAGALMNNHGNLVGTLGKARAVSRLMPASARGYVGTLNGRQGRTDTPRAGRYFELNPIRAWMVAKPAKYPGSSYGANADGRMDLLLTPHPECLALDGNPLTRTLARPCLPMCCQTRR